MTRVLLVLPTATYRAEAFLAAAGRLGAEVVTASERRQALAGQMGDRFVLLDLADAELGARQIAELSRRSPLDAVLAVDDQGAEAAALAAARLGLVHNPPDAVAATRDKAEMRRRLGAAGVTQPEHRLVGAGPDELERVAAAGAELGYPVVVKPCTLSASRGVVRGDDPAGAAEAARIARRVLAEAGRGGEPLLVEAFVPGEEVALEGLLRAGSFEALAVFDKPDPLDGPYFEETIYTTPSRHDPAEVDAAVRLVASACAAIGLVEGPVHAEVRLSPAAAGIRRPVLIEVAARTIGGRCAAALRHATGVPLEETVLAHALGLPRRLASARRAAGVMMLPIASSGVLVEVAGREAALAVEHVSALEVTIPAGRPIRALPEGDRYLGFLFAEADDPALVEAALRAGWAALDVRIEAGPPGDDAPGCGETT